MMSQRHEYDLEDRTGRFGADVIRFCRSVPSNAVNTPLVSPLVRAGTSVGANYCEANDAESRRDFRHKIGICRKESRECQHWLRMMGVAVPARRANAEQLAGEAAELNRIFGAILRKLDGERV
jgi:four helix bundle protein